MLPWQNLGPSAHGFEVGKQNLIAASLHHTVMAFINIWASMIGCLVHINISLKAVILINMKGKHSLYVVKQLIQGDKNSARQQHFI